ncbi:SubName: Full=Uncharacterized protein {ECO:0000313/EMBL:CCA68093.1} [Serendipita indica DSM 11827]|uniref:KIF-binding protein n=1 Tax=Serendipita indica (strain DSM 11827) TaxID=1109443 RepID=G4T9U0_SERID|nr:SubName: Full=Uncharacterized protein {ECO:0000313/EMBL:CCA68093.1} [Serendipita indica DSM 11827]CCA68093.1 hypothetical protein PIIN_01961 [Serendipita indica DSM 11827]
MPKSRLILVFSPLYSTNVVTKRPFHHTVPQRAAATEHPFSIHNLGTPRPKITNSREERMRKESVQLWRRVSDLWQSKTYDEAIALCRKQLADPFAHVPEPRCGTVDELRTMGHFLLGRLLVEVYNASYLDLDPAMEDEALEQVRLAKRGLELYYPDALVLQAKAVGCLAGILEDRGSLVDAAEEYRTLIRLNKRILQQEMVSRVKSGGDALSGLLDALRRLAMCASRLGHSRTALAAAQEAMEVLRKCNAHKSNDPRVTTILLETILEQARYTLESGGDTNHALKDISAAIEILDKVGVALTSEPDRYYAVMARYASQLAVFARKLVQTGVPELMEHGGSLFETVASTFHNVIQLPEDREGLPDRVHTVYCLQYAQAIVHYSHSFGYTGDEYDVAVLDRALEMVLMSAYTDVPPSIREQQHVSSPDAHAYYLTEFEWPTLDIPQSLLALTILNMEMTKRIDTLKSTSFSLRRGFSRHETEVVRAEIQRAFILAESVQARTTSEEIRREVTVQRATTLYNRGKLELRSSRSTAKATWAQARELVEASGKCLDVEKERERIYLLKTLHECLAAVP